MLDALEFVGLVNDGLEFLFAHCRAGCGEALSFFSLFFLEKGGVRLKYESGAVGIVQKEPFDHALKKQGICSQLGFYLCKGSLKGEQGHGVSVVKPGSKCTQHK